MHALLNIALRAARDASEALAHQSDRLDRVKIIEDSPTRVLTSAEQDSEKTILYHLQKVHPEHSFSSTVSGNIPGKDKSTVWLIDPLAGSRNFIHGIPRFAVSVACQIDNKICHSVLIDPLLNEEFTASRGKGAHLNGRRLRASTRKSLEGGIASLDVQPTDASIDRLLDYQKAIYGAGAMMRMSGCSVLDLAHAAAGRIEGGIADYPGALSIAAAALVLQESGGLLSDSRGNPELKNTTSVVYGNPKCFKQLLQLEKALAE